MKFFLLACLVAVAAAEPESFYGSNLYANQYTAGVYNPYGAGVVRPAAVYSGYNAGVYSGFNGYYGAQYPRTTFGYAKRDADAEADPAVFYNNMYQPYAAQHGFVQQPYYQQYAAQVAGEPVLKVGTHHTNLRNVLNKGLYPAQGQVYQPVYNTYAKRDADAEPVWPYTTNTFANQYYQTPVVRAGVYNQAYPVRTAYNGLYNQGVYGFNNGYYQY